MSGSVPPIRAARMSLRIASFSLAVDDLDQALAFYRDVLGFEVSGDVPSLEAPCVALAPPLQPDMRLLLVARPADPSAGRWTVADDLLHRVDFATDDCDAVFEHLEAAGAEVIQEPIDRPGVRDCAFLDPSENVLRFTQATSAGPRHRCR
ncbi:VOC family protein [Actinomadura geliboluensis]|uniref:VOC family protein n=1 Tax=Actinomadura geliboluensis TaxID=882440 RepID=UPI0036922845